MAYNKKNRRRRKINTGPCRFCKEGAEPAYREPAVLRRYLSPRGKILGSTKTGVCAKHQRKLREAVKRSRFLSFLPFVENQR